MVKDDNPAGRLRLLLDRGKDNASMTIADSWRRILHQDSDPEGPLDDSTLLERLGMVEALPAAIRQKVLALDDADHELLLREMPKVEGALHMPRTATWEGFMAVVDATALYGLDHISEYLSRQSPEPTVRQSGLDWLRGQVRELFDDITASQVDDDLRQFLLRHVQAMDAAIQEVLIRGAVAIQEVVEGAVGGAFLRYAEKGDPPEGKGRTYWKKLLGIAATLSLLIGLGNDAFELGDSVYKALPMPEQHETTDDDSGKP